MNHNENNNVESKNHVEMHESSLCAQTQKEIQLYMDSQNPISELMFKHSQKCPDCGLTYRAAVKLLQALKNFHCPETPADCGDKVLARLQSTPYRPILSRRSLWYAAGALAASLLLGFFLFKPAANTPTPEGLPGPALVRSTPPSQLESGPLVTETPPIGPALTDAQTAVVTLTRKATGEAMQVNLPHWHLAPVPNSPLDSLEPALTTFQDVGHHAIYCVSPLTHSARKAVSLIFQEMAPENK